MIYQVYNETHIPRFEDWLADRKYFTYDLETGPQLQYVGTETESKAGLDPYLGDITLILVGDKDTQFVIDNRAGLDIPLLKQKLEDDTTTVIGVNLRFDLKFTQLHKSWYPRKLFDCQIVEQLLRTGIFAADDGASPGHIRKLTSMASLVRFYFNEEIDKDQALRTGFWRTPIGELNERQLAYAAGDLVWPERIARKQKILIHERQLEDVVTLESRLIPVLADMELQGMMLDQDMWLDLYQQATIKLAECHRKLDKVFNNVAVIQDDLFGESTIERKIQYSSPAQLARALHAKGYAGFVDPKTNKTKTTESKKFIIAKMTGEIPAEVCDPIIEMRKHEQRIENYGLKFLQKVHPVTARIHPTFTQATLVTGRISATPGVQTIPARGDGSVYRNAFIPGDGYLFSICDASQIEARITTDLTGDPVALKVFLNDWDIYKHDGELFYNVPIDKETPEGKALRNNAKAAWLGLSYGQGKVKFRLFMMLNTGRVVTQEESDYLYDKFFEVHWVMKEKMEVWSRVVAPDSDEQWLVDDLARELVNVDRPIGDTGLSVRQMMISRLTTRFNGDALRATKKANQIFSNIGKVHYAEAYAGRKRFFRLDYLGYHTAGRNAPVQTGAAHIQKESMIELHEFIKREKFDAHLLNAIHDEIIVRVRADQAEEFYPHHKRIMTEVGARYLKEVPMKVEGGLAEYWKKF